MICMDPIRMKARTVIKGEVSGLSYKPLARKSEVVTHVLQRLWYFTPLQAKQLGCHSFIRGCWEKTQTPGSETKDFLTHGTATRTSTGRGASPP